MDTTVTDEQVFGAATAHGAAIGLLLHELDAPLSFKEALLDLMATLSPDELDELVKELTATVLTQSVRQADERYAAGALAIDEETTLALQTLLKQPLSQTT